MLNKVMLIGNLGRDPEMRYTPSGKAVTSFSIAVNDGYGEKRHTTWFRVECWDKLAEIAAEYARKGSTVYVEGRLAIDEWEEKDTHAKRERAKVIARDVTVIAGRAPKNENPFEPRSLPNAEEAELSELPF